MDAIATKLPQDQAKATIKPLGTHVAETVTRYIESLGGNKPIELFKLVTEEVETALYETVMKYTKGNQSEAARLLGVSRGTLRTKLAEYFGTTHIGH
jgi:Fis family transcriptional regulator